MIPMIKTTALLIAALFCATAVLPGTFAQDGAVHGQDSEFGSIRAAYSADMNGARVPVSATVTLRHNYEDQGSRFFMFAWTVEQTPLDVSFDSLVRTDTNAEMPCYQRQGDAHSQLKCFVDLKDMPPVDTNIVLKGTVGSSKVGSFQVGAIVVPFTYSWLRVKTSNGLDAELYGYTMINVQKATSGAGRIGGLGNAVPGVGTIGMIGAVGVVAAVLAARKRKN
jgi:hypothetical protein